MKTTMYRHWHERKNKCDVEVNFYMTIEEAEEKALDNWRSLTVAERKNTFLDFIEKVEVEIYNDEMLSLDWLGDVMCIVSNGELQDGYDYTSRDGLLREESGVIE